MATGSTVTHSLLTPDVVLDLRHTVPLAGIVFENLLQKS